MTTLRISCGQESKDQRYTWRRNDALWRRFRNTVWLGCRSRSQCIYLTGAFWSFWHQTTPMNTIIVGRICPPQRLRFVGEEGFIAPVCHGYKSQRIPLLCNVSIRLTRRMSGPFDFSFGDIRTVSWGYLRLISIFSVSMREKCFFLEQTG